MDPLSSTSVNDIPLLRTGWTGGAAFELDRDSETTVQLEFDGGWTLELVAGRKTCLVRGADSRGARAVHESSFIAATRGLDLICANDGPVHAVNSAADEAIVFWPGGNGLELRWISTYRFGFKLRASAAVVRNGVTMPGAVNRWIHDPSFGHFRRSELEQDLGDSYRHAYLALESLLDTIYPQIPGVSEGDWVLAALQAADNIVRIQQLGGRRASGETMPEVAKRRWYHEERLSLFHSKPSRSPGVNSVIEDFESLLVKKQELLGFYVSLARVVLKLQRGAGAMTYEAFELLLSGIDERGAVTVAMDDAQPRNLGKATSTLREIYSANQVGEGSFACRRLSVPASRRLRRWDFGDPGNPGFFTELSQGAIVLDERDLIGTRIRLTLGSGDYRGKYLT